MGLTIGLTDDRVNEEKYALYEKWIIEMAGRTDAAVSGNGRPGPVRTIRLTPADGNSALASGCDGVILTGGGDVDPVLYGGDPAHPGLYEVSAVRDSFEIGVLNSCLAARIPVLGICRGLQVANVALGGTLIPDLAEAGYGTHRPAKGGRCEHRVFLAPGTRLGAAAGVTEGMAVSSHHQAAGKVGRGLRVAATSPDGVTEALEAEDGGLLLVQWHPERMEDRGEPLCGGPGKVFLQSISSRKKSNDDL